MESVAVVEEVEEHWTFSFKVFIDGNMVAVVEEVEKRPLAFCFIVYNGRNMALRGIYLIKQGEEGAQSQASVLPTGTVPGDSKPIDFVIWLIIFCPWWPKINRFCNDTDLLYVPGTIQFAQSMATANVQAIGEFTDLEKHL